MRNERLTLRFQSIGDMALYAVKKGEIENPWGIRGGRNYKYTIHVSTQHGKTSFTFTDSVANWTKGVTKLDKETLFNALDCLLSDIAMYLNGDIDGCYENEKEARRVENACRKEWENFKKVIGDCDFWDVDNEYRNMYEYYIENGFVDIDKTED